MNISDTARLFGVSPSTLYRAYRSGKINPAAVRLVPGSGDEPAVRLNVEMLDREWSGGRGPGRPPGSKELRRMPCDP